MADTSWWREITELDEEQQKVISLPQEGNFLIVGPPGSGKTNLLLLRAQFLVASGRPNVVVVMFTKTLRNFVMRGGPTYNFSPEKVLTFMAWENGILREHGIKVDRSTSFDQYRGELSKRLIELFDAKPALEHQLECVLVDEVQDCTPDEIDLFFRAAKNVFFVGDHRQQIYDSDGILERIGSRAERHELTHHYRNGMEICKVADAIGAPMGAPPLVPTCNYKEKQAPSRVTYEECANEDDQFDKLCKRLKTQVVAYPEELIGVALATNQDVNAMRDRLRASDLSDSVASEDELFDAFRPDARIFVCTIHDAKGLEFRVMHLPFIEHVKCFNQRQRRVSYTAVTRAKTSLSLYSVDRLPPHLEPAREVIFGPRPPPDPSALFPGKRS